MAAEEGDTGQPRRRRSSFAELFAARPSVDASSAQGNSARTFQSSLATSVTQQAQQQSRTRRLSITTLGLSGSPNQATSASPFGTLKRGSGTGGSSGRRGSVDLNESAVEDGEPGPLTSPASDSNGGVAPRPISRRLSFGAKAYRDMRTSGSGVDSSSDSSPPTVLSSRTASAPQSRGSEGFNWSDNLLNRAKRTSIPAVSSFGSPGSGPPAAAAYHARAHTITAGQQPPAPQVTKPLQKTPDHFQERILKGDFYMD